MKRKYKLEIVVDADDNVTHVSRVQVQTPLDVPNKVDGISEVTPKQGWRPVRNGVVRELRTGCLYYRPLLNTAGLTFGVNDITDVLRAFSLR